MRLTTGRFAAPALFLAAGLLVVAAGGAGGQPGKDKEPGTAKKEKDGPDKDAKERKDKDAGPKGGPEKDAKELRQAFDGITEAAQTPPAGKEATRLFDHAKSFYRAAVKAYPDDPRRSRELAVAAGDAVRGLEHLRRASFQPVSGLPEPPADLDGPPPPKDGPRGKDAPPPPPKDGPRGKDAPPPKDGPKDGPKDRGPGGRSAERGPWTPALDALTEVQDQLTGANAPEKGPGKDFFDAAKTAYRDARKAYEAADYRKAGELARAADAWLRVGGHLDRAQWDGPAASAGPAPEPKRKGPPPLPPLKD
jgi:hypothetical protein